MSFPQVKTCRVSFYLGNGVSLDAIVTGPFVNDADAKREAITRVLHGLSAANEDQSPMRILSEMSLNSVASNVEQLFGGAK